MSLHISYTLLFNNTKGFFSIFIIKFPKTNLLKAIIDLFKLIKKC